MKDSHPGIYGLIAMVLSALLRATALAALVVSCGPVIAALFYIAAAIVARGCLVLQWRLLACAREDGTAAAMGRPGVRPTASAAAITLALAVAIGMQTHMLKQIIAALACAAIATIVFSAFVNRRIGGHTSETLGATAQIAEMVFLPTLAIAV